MHLRTILSAFIALIFAFAFVTSDALAQEDADDDRELEIGADIVGGFQFLDHSNAQFADGGDIEPLNPGFQNAAGNLNFHYPITDGIDLEWNFFMSNPTHLLEVTLTEGYAWIDQVPEAINVGNINNNVLQYVDLKVGQFYVNYGDQLFRRSNNADVQSNPLVGNFLMDPVRVGLGAELYVDFDVVEAMVGLHQPGTADFSQGQRNAFLGMLAFNAPDELARLRGSFYSADASGNPPAFEGSRAALFATTRTPARYMDVLAGQHQPLPTAGQDLTAYQIEGTFAPDPIEVWGLFGYTQDSNTTGSREGSPEESWLYWGAEASVDLTDSFHLASRYSGTAPDKLGDVEADGNVHRIQAGFGYEISDGILFKAEYVNQWFRNFEQSTGFDGLDLTEDPRFYGVVTEISFSF